MHGSKKISFLFNALVQKKSILFAYALKMNKKYGFIIVKKFKLGVRFNSWTKLVNNHKIIKHRDHQYHTRK